MAGKYMPIPTSSSRKEMKEIMVSMGEAFGLQLKYLEMFKSMRGHVYPAVTQQMPMLTDIIINTILRMLASLWPLLLRMEKRLEPTMMQTMKQEKTMPRGVEPVSRTGVQRNTKMYMHDSSRDWQVPSSST